MPDISPVDAVMRPELVIASAVNVFAPMARVPLVTVNWLAWSVPVAAVNVTPPPFRIRVE
jgi:hypothetical protein